MKRRAKPSPVEWFARANGIKRMGPYPTQIAAWRALFGLDGVPVPGATVWPEARRSQ